jgi:hypothetical protein
VLILFDHGAPKGLIRALPGHTVDTAQDKGVPDWQRRGIERVARQVDLYTTLEGAEETDRVEKQIARM